MSDRPTVPTSSSQAISTNQDEKLICNTQPRHPGMFGIFGFLLSQLRAGYLGWTDVELLFWGPRPTTGRPLLHYLALTPTLTLFFIKMLSAARDFKSSTIRQDADLFVESQRWKLSLAKRNAWTQRRVDIYENHSPKFRKVSVAVGGSLKYPNRLAVEIVSGFWNHCCNNDNDSSAQEDVKDSRSTSWNPLRISRR